MPRPALNQEALIAETTAFATLQSALPVPELYGVTDGKAVGTHIEKGFKAYLEGKYLFEQGNAAKGIDFPELEIDIKVTSIDQPQSSSPFKSARQKPKAFSAKMRGTPQKPWSKMPALVAARMARFCWAS